MNKHRPPLVLTILILFTLILPAGSVYCEDTQPAAAQPTPKSVNPDKVSQDVSRAAKLLRNAVKEKGKGNLLKAKDLYKKALSELESIEDNRKAIQGALEDLNMKILFSQTLTPDSVVYEVKSGDSLQVLAKRFNTTVALIKRANGLKSDLIRVGDKLKVIKTEFAVVVNRSSNLLCLKMGDEIIKTYSCATGKDGATPVGTFKIINKLEDPTWYKAGAVVPPGSPENSLGTRWMGISSPGYGIHGTIEPESIGHSVTSGCVRMHNQDVEELYTIVPVGTVVIIEG
ncbi:MAG: L,D-transpeptidase family protein [Candidatus Omnitrophica bacterium]|nr:L,D-transpeptidase family protein [Candidatus Omnitrophota bacterium]